MNSCNEFSELRVSYVEKTEGEDSGFSQESTFYKLKSVSGRKLPIT